MEFESQKIDELLAALSPLSIEWQDETSKKVVSLLAGFPIKPQYSLQDIEPLLAKDFETGSLLVRLFLALSKDAYQAELRGLLGDGGIGAKGFKTNPGRYLDALEKLGLTSSIGAVVNRELVWSDILVERLRSGRGSAVSGQKRGRYVEDFVETIVKDVFGAYEPRCNFIGQRGNTAKCDFAIPTKSSPRIVIESKGYGATGSKMTDVIGDIEKIIAAKRADTVFVFFTDGLSWLQRKSDFRKIVEYQNQGDIFRIYTLKMADLFRADLELLKREQGL